MAALSTLVKLVQLLMLAVGALVFTLGAYQIGSEIFFRLKHTRVIGKVTGHKKVIERRQSLTAASVVTRFEAIELKYPIVQYQWPPESGRLYTVTSVINTEFVPDPDRFDVGREAAVRIDPQAPSDARVEMPWQALFWPIIGFVTGLAALIVVSGLFYLHEGALGGDLSRGVSIFREMSASAVLSALLIALSAFAVVRFIAPWLGPQELKALATGDLRALPALILAQGDRTEGELLGPAERAIVSLPGVGAAFAAETAERAARSEDGLAHLRRYLKARAEGQVSFELDRPVDAAASAGRDEALAALLDAGAPLRTETLRAAVFHGHVQTVKLLLDRGARSEPDVLGNSVLDQALLTGRSAELVRMLSQRGIPSRLPAAYREAAVGDASSLERVLPRAQWAGFNHEYQGLIQVAARFGNVPLGRELIRAGLDPLRRGVATHPPLEHALAQDQWEFAELLWEAGADINYACSTVKGYTALHLAAAQGDLNRVRWLLQKGANPAAASFEQLKPLDIARGSEVAEELRSRN